jgi:endonuclease G
MTRRHPPGYRRIPATYRGIPVRLLVALAAAFIVFALRWYQEHHAGPDNGTVVRRPANPPEGQGPTPEPGGSIHLTMGNPSGAAPDPADRDNYLMVTPYFALSCNNTKGTPNWVSWCLKEDDLGDAERAQFYPDPYLPRSFKHVTSHDYTGSGFDRGHMCPHGDRAGSPEAANATFAMTNIVPQSPSCNQKAWADLEDYVRGLVARKNRAVYVVAGPAGRGGQGTKGPADDIADGKVTVPNKVWKVALVVDGGTCGPEDVAKVGPESRLIAVIMPNDESVRSGWAKYRTSAAEVERLTGFHFFDRVPAEVIGPLKEQTDRQHIPPARPHRGRD